MAEIAEGQTNEVRMPTVHFYTHQSIEEFDPARTLWDRLCRRLVRWASPRFGHCSFEGNLYAAELTRRGFRLGTGMANKGDVEVEVRDVRQVEDPGNECLLLRMALGWLLPRRFTNCASFVGRIVGVEAGTPDKLYMALAVRNYQPGPRVVNLLNES
jgi:hypothetical protein